MSFHYWDVDVCKWWLCLCTCWFDCRHSVI